MSQSSSSRSLIADGDRVYVDPDAPIRRRLDRLARVLDSAFVIPVLGWRFGFDVLLNLVPVAGWAASLALSAYLVWQARRLSAPPSLITRMIANIGLDALISAIPLAGWLVDIGFKANHRNMALLRRHLDQGRPWRAGYRPGERVGPVIDGETARLP
jgi:Domain of unknown function (DUF4112)